MAIDPAFQCFSLCEPWQANLCLKTILVFTELLQDIWTKLPLENVFPPLGKEGTRQWSQDGSLLA